MREMRIGHGYDVHRLVEGRKLILGGAEIPWEKGLLGHSDADVLVHAVMDSLLGAAGLGDIGGHFPDTDPAYAGADSLEMLSHVVALLAEQGFSVGNVDATVLAQRPKLAPYIPQMKEGLARAMGIDPSQVNVKATTEEGLGFTGSGEGMAAHAVCLIGKEDRGRRPDPADGAGPPGSTTGQVLFGPPPSIRPKGQCSAQVDRSTSSQPHSSSMPASQNRARWRSITTPGSSP